MYSQNTIEWEVMRKNKIGASDAPIIMEVSPYKTPYQLWQEKLDLVPPQEKTRAMVRGHDLEDKARRRLEEMTSTLFLPNVKFHPTLSWMMASLDGIDIDGKIIAEIKCPNKHDHEMAVKGIVPEKYLPQLQHQMEVSQVDSMYYFSFDGENGTLIKVYRDEAYIKGMIQKEKEFWECMQSFTAPLLIDRDYQERTDNEWIVVAEEWIKVNKSYKEIEKMEKALKDKLIHLSQNRNCKGGGVKYSSYIRKGSIDYESIPELKAVNLDLYRKNPIQVNRLTSD